jgi:hypothetical protein
MQEKQAWVKAYQSVGFVVIPLVSGRKTPVGGLSLEEIYDGKYTWNGELKKDENIGIVTGRSGLIVIDCDTLDAALWFESRENYKPTARVKTKRGVHFYYRIPFAISLNLHTRRLKDIDIDVKTGRSYVVAPPSVVDGHIYTWEPPDWDIAPPIATLTENELDILLRELELTGLAKNSEPKAQMLTREQIDGLSALLRDIYTPGRRQDLCLGLAGVLRKTGYSMEDAKALVQYIHTVYHDSDPLPQRLSAVEQTFNKPNTEIAAWSMIPSNIRDSVAKILIGKTKTGENTPVKALNRDEIDIIKKDIKENLYRGLTIDECIQQTEIKYNFFTNKNQISAIADEVYTEIIRDITSEIYRELHECISQNLENTIPDVSSRNITSQVGIEVERNRQFFRQHFINRIYAEENWLCKDLIYQNSIVLIDALGATGKSYLALQLAISYISDEFFITERFRWNPTRTKKVLYITTQLENPIEITNNRILQILDHTNTEPQLILDNLHVAYMAHFFNTESETQLIQPTEIWGQLVEYIIIERIELVIIDPIQQFFLVDMNSNEKVTAIYRTLSDVGTTWVLIHHQPKASISSSVENTTQRGASALRDNARMRIAMKRQTILMDETERRVMDVYIEKNNFSPINQHHIFMTPTPPFQLIWGPVDDETFQAEQKRQQRIIEQQRRRRSNVREEEEDW